MQTTLTAFDHSERLKIKDISETEEEFQEIEIEQQPAIHYVGEECKQKKQLSMVIEEGKQEEDNSERKDEEEQQHPLNEPINEQL